MADFDKIIDRRGTGSLKWDRFQHSDIIPMWVADMDFQAPEPVRKALQERIEHGVYGYSVPTEKLNQTVVNRLKRLYYWQIEPEWIVWLPGLVVGLNIVSRYVQENEELITFVPAYPPFLDAPAYAKRKLKTVPLLFENNRYGFNLKGLEKSISAQTRLFILCNPHNPTGRVLDKDELQAVADICLNNDIIICSDEVHCELILCDKKHIPVATLNKKIQDRTITLMSPAKTFNLAGLNCGFAVISDRSIRKRFIHIMRSIAPSCVNALGFAACQAAYSECEQWRSSLLKYLAENKNIVFDFVNNQIPLLSMADLEATYLAWVDARKLNVPDPVSFFEQAGVGLSDGREFGAEGFVRLNFGCPRKILLQGLERMKTAVIKSIDSPG